MGGDLYIIECFYGYEIKINEPWSFKNIVKILIDLEGIIDDRLEYAAILSEFHSRMEGMTEKELKEMYEEHATLIIGFKTNGDLSKMMELADFLKEYIKNIPFFELDFVENPDFFYGINVFREVFNMYFSYYEHGSDYDSDEINSDDYETETDNSDDSEDENTSDEDEEKVAPDMK